MFILAHLSDIHLAPLPRPNPFELLSKRGLGYINWLRKKKDTGSSGQTPVLVRNGSKPGGKVLAKPGK